MKQNALTISIYSLLFNYDKNSILTSHAWAYHACELIIHVFIIELILSIFFLHFRERKFQEAEFVGSFIKRELQFQRIPWIKNISNIIHNFEDYWTAKMSRCNMKNCCTFIYSDIILEILGKRRSETIQNLLLLTFTKTFKKYFSILVLSMAIYLCVAPFGRILHFWFVQTGLYWSI